MFPVMGRTKIRDRNILFLCEDNACLSLMAEAIGNRLRPPQALVFSAGVQPRPADARTLTALTERGIAPPETSSKGLDAVCTVDIHLIIALGGVAAPNGFFTRDAKWDRWLLPDPRQEAGNALEPFHRAIDEIDVRVAGLFLDYWRNFV
jgi:protein-tyrosine-phosphatase